MKRLTILLYTLFIACISVSATTMTADEKKAMDFLYESMPLSDKLMYTSDFYLRNVKIAFRAKQEMPWGKSVPDDVFRHFVLPVRANNEYLDDFRTTYYEELKNRIKGLSMYDAALEVNHWLHEKVTYEPSDSRTSAPMATICTSKGRCGEESVLGVTAMRTVGIPARQVYTPRWAHTDDNHAWVEVWVDGKWYFLGACEPEPELNRAWFNSPVSRGMLMHTRVFGDYQGPEVLSRKGNITEINVTGNYVPLRTSTVTVYDKQGNPAKNVPVEFKLYNYAEFYTVARRTTDEKGRASLQSGMGDLVAWATDGKYFGFAKVSGETTTLQMEHQIGETLSFDLDIVPPAEHPIPSHATEAQIAENAKRMHQEDSIRTAYMATFFSIEQFNSGKYGKDPLLSADSRIPGILAKAKGNWHNIKDFLANVSPERLNEAIGMLEAVSEKDLRDTPASIFTRTLSATVPQPENPLYIKYVLNPRIANELLSAYREEIAPLHKTAEGIMEFVANEIKIEDEANSYRVPIIPAEAWRNKVADRRSRNILYVALCRNEGIPARINEITGKTQYHNGNQWLDVDFEKAETNEHPKGWIKAAYQPVPYLKDPQYYRHFTLSELSSGSPNLLEFDEYEATLSTTIGKGIEIDEGYYMLTSGTRMADGSVMAHVEIFPVAAGKTTECKLVMRQNDQEVSVIGNMDCEALYQPENSQQPASILSTTGRGYFAIAILGANDEPSNHAVLELEALAPILNDWSRPLLVLKPGAAHRDELSCIQNLHYGIDTDNKIADMLRTGTESEKTELPVVVIADSFGRIVFISEGYDTSLAEKMKHVISKL